MNAPAPVLTLAKHRPDTEALRRSAASLHHKRRPGDSANANEPRQFHQAELRGSSRAQWFWTGFRMPDAAPLQQIPLQDLL